MNRSDEILRALGRIEGEVKSQSVDIGNALAEIRAVSERVRTLEVRHARLGGAWAALGAVCAILFRLALQLAHIF